MNDKARQHVLAALIIILLLLCVVSSFYSFPIQYAKADALPPTVTINFVGNLSDDGGPYWSQWNETTAYIGVWGNGSYTNDSRQQEDWMYINCTVSDGDGVANVWLNWYNLTGDVWTNWTYAFLNPNGDWWEYNTSGNVQVNEGYDYSFDVVANDTIPNSVTREWNKTAMYGDIGANHITRRYVQLNCSTTNISYSPFYVLEKNETHSDSEDDWKKDRLHHDQGTDGTSYDTGYLLNDTLNDDVNFIRCSLFTGNWFDESVCAESFTLDNIYYHVWWEDNDEHIRIRWKKYRQEVTSDDNMLNDVDLYDTTAVSNITYDNGNPSWSNDYHLNTGLIDVDDTNFTDNSIYEIYVQFHGINYHNPSTICNISIQSFVLFNVPDNATLNASHADTDSDGLSDWTELYVNYTNPFLNDTDNDGISDYDESISGSDPNNYTSTIEADLNTTVDTISPYNQTVTPLTITATVNAGTPDNISLYYRYSEDNSTWGTSGGGDSTSFGDTGTGGTARAMGNRVEGSIFTMGATGGTANNLSIWIKSKDQSNKWALAIYVADGSEVIANGYTEERDIGPEADAGWEVFNFSTPPTLEASTNYLLVVWGNHADCLFYCTVSDNNAYTDTEIYSYPSFPEPHVMTVRTGQGPYHIFCNYTESASGSGINWTLFEEDTASPWSWSFDFPSDTGYYEFYSIANKSGLSNESAPTNNDTICQKLAFWSNTAPTFSSESPTNESTGESLQPTVVVTITDADGNQSTCDFYTSTDGSSWTWRQQNTTILNESISYDYTQASSYSTLYYWKVTANDTHDNSSVIYHFTTESEPGAGTSYYVKNGGNDGASGLNDTNAWATIGQVNTALGDGTISQGDNIYFKCGDDFSSATTLYLEVGGTSSNPMIFGAYGTGAKPILADTDGNGRAIRDTRMNNNEGFFTIQDIQITGNGHNNIQLRPETSGHTGINNITIRRVDITGGSYGIILSGINTFSIENCTATNIGGSGFAVLGSTNGVNAATNGTFRNLTVNNAGVDGIVFHMLGDLYANYVGSNMWVDNCTIDNVDEAGIDVTPGSNPSFNIYINNTVLSNCSQAGIAEGHGTKNETYENIIIRDCTDGILFTRDQNARMRYSVIESCSDDSIVINQNSVTNYYCKNITIYNNDIIASSSSEDHLQVMKDPDDGGITEYLTFKNNIFYSTASSIPTRYIYYISACQVNLSNTYSNWTKNMWWRGDGIGSSQIWTNGNEGTLAFTQWNASVEVDNDLLDNPEFVDAAGENYHLNDTSPCIDTGDWLTQTDGSDTSEWITVDDANYFFAGLSTIGVTGDNIFVGTDTDLVITEINYANESFKVNRSITWADNEDVSLSSYNSTAPDIGAKEFAGAVAWYNSAPSITSSSENPPDTQTSVDQLLTNYYNHFNISITDADNSNQTVNVTWRTNESGSWLDMGYNESSECNSTFYCTNVSWIDTAITKYWWSINVSDNHSTKGWNNETFSFTTEPSNTAPTLTGESPTNTSTGISITPKLYVICTDVDAGDTMNVTWRSNSSGTWVDFATNSSISTGINITQYNSNFDAYSTTYWWSVNLTDGTEWTNETYHFTTATEITSPTNLVADNPTTSSISLEWNKGYTNGTLVHNLLYVDNFTKYGANPIFDKSDTGDWASYGIRENILLTNSTGYIVKVDGKYVMYFNGRNTTNPPDPKFTRVGRANSSDGITWTVNSSYVFNDTGADFYTFVGSVMQLDNGTYRMYYTAHNIFDPTNNYIRYATSIDSITWTTQDDLLDETDFTGVNSIAVYHVIYFDGEWHMMLEGTVAGGAFGIYYANSSDGITWTATADAIYSGGASGEWDDEDVANPQLFKLATSKYVIFYNGNGNAIPNLEFDLGIIYSTNLTSGWTSWKNNPILERGTDAEWDDERIEGPRIYMDDVGNATLRMWYFGLPTTGSFEDGAIGYAICNETIMNTMVRYSTSNNLTTYTDGSLGYDGADSYTTITELDPDTTYYFRAWSWNDTHGWNTVGSNTVTETTNVESLWSNSNPVNSNPDPQSGNTSVSLTPTLRIQVNDVDMANQSVDTTWMSNSSGSWVQFGSNTSSNNATFYQMFTNASAYSTTYYWSTNTSDGNGGWDNDTYSFTTLANIPPSISNPSPGNGTTGVGVSLSSLSVTIEDNEDTFNWTITTNPDVGSNSANGAINGSKTCSISGLSYDGYYTWTVSVTDGLSWTNTTYDFTVESHPGGGPPINSAPTASNPYPADEDTILHSVPVCHVLVADADLDSINVSFYWYNETSQWEKMQTNSSVASGNTVYWTFSNASEYDTTYYWRVTVDDGTDNITYSYSFTIYPNEPVITSSSPVDDVIGVVRNASLSITVFDYQGDSMDITWRSNSSGSWISFDTNNSVGNGTYSQNFINSTRYNTKYWWSVNISGSWTNATYSFTTELNVAPVITDPIPRDGRRWVSIYMANISIMITDVNSNFNYTIQTSPDVGSISGNNVGDGVKTCVVSSLNYSTTYTWYVNATDGISWTNTSYSFTTKGSTDFDIEDVKLNLPEWAMGPYKVYVGDFIWMFLFVGVIAMTWGASDHVSSVLVVILLTFAAYSTQRVFVDNSEISLLFSLIAAACVAAMMLGLFLRKKRG